MFLIRHKIFLSTTIPYDFLLTIIKVKSSCHKRYHLAFTAECRCSKHEGTIWFSANRWQAARWCHTRSLVCWKIHGLGCHSGPHLCCIILVVDSTLGRFCSWPDCCSQACPICIVACNPCVWPHCLRNSWACKW